MNPRLPTNEYERLSRLQQTGILGTQRDPEFDAITQFCAEVFQAPICLVSIVAEDYQWFKSSVGLDLCETSRADSICAHAILEESSPLVISDTLHDPRTADNNLVHGPPYIRFYAGEVITSHDGYPLGTLCVIDRVPREATEFQLRALKMLAGQVSALIRHRETLMQLNEQVLEREELMLQSQERQFLLNLILNAQEDAVALVSVKGNIVWSNRYAKDLLSWKGREEPDQPIYEIWPWGADALERVVRLVQRGRSIQYTTEYEDAGQMRWFDIRVHPVQDFHGANTRFLAICRDVTNERLTAREAMTHRALVEASRDCILITDEQGQIRYSNATSRKILKLADRPQSKADELIVSIDGSELTEEIYAAVNARGTWDGRLLLNDPENPSSMLYEGHVYPIGGKQSEIGLGWILRDITEQSVLERDLRQSNIEVTKSNILLEEKVALVEEQSTALMIQKEALTRLNHELKQLSETDYLTKIKNRRYGLSAASRMLIQRQRAQTSVGCIMFDIDHFKSINDTHGHAVGDQVLVAVTRAAQVVLDSTSVFARWGGEEFIIFLPDSSLYRTGVVAEKIRAEIQRAPIAGVLVTSSFGISASLEDEEDPEQLIERADTALYASKRGGRNRTTAWSNYLAEKLPATCYRLDYELHQHSA